MMNRDGQRRARLDAGLIAHTDRGSQSPASPAPTDRTRHSPHWWAPAGHRQAAGWQAAGEELLERLWQMCASPVEGDLAAPARLAQLTAGRIGSEPSQFSAASRNIVKKRCKRSTSAWISTSWPSEAELSWKLWSTGRCTRCVIRSPRWLSLSPRTSTGSKQLGHESTRTKLKHYARFVQAVDERNMLLLDDFAAQAAGDVSDAVSCRRGERHLINARKGLFPGPFMMELAGLEPATSWVRSRRSPS
jgi:hypothetical protein